MVRVSAKAFVSVQRLLGKGIRPIRHFTEVSRAQKNLSQMQLDTVLGSTADDIFLVDTARGGVDQDSMRPMMSGAERILGRKMSLNGRALRLPL